MLASLDHALRSTLPALLKDWSKWDSLIVNRRKPHTYRVFTTLEDGNRICLHKFNPCDTHEAFQHPHPWPGAFIIMKGSYQMKVWAGKTREDNEPQEVSEFILRPYSAYSITNPLTWHSVVPLETTYTIMINGEPFSPEVAHVGVRRTGGKDLDKMPEDELMQHLSLFENFVGEYNAKQCSACDGTGVNSPAHPWGSPKCGECDGTGKRQ